MTSRTSPTSPATGTPVAAGSLEPVRRALLDDATAEAERIRAEARQHADADADEAEREVADEVDQVARRQAIASTAHADQVRARAHAEAHAMMLGAREELRQELLATVRSAALQLRDDERYPALLDQLETLARVQLGADADVQRDPPDGGGVVVVVGTRRVDYSLPALAERALRDHGDEVSSLWT